MIPARGDLVSQKPGPSGRGWFRPWRSRNLSPRPPAATPGRRGDSHFREGGRNPVETITSKHLFLMME